MSAVLEIDRTMPWSNWTAPTLHESNLTKLVVAPNEENTGLDLLIRDERIGRVDSGTMRELGTKAGFPVRFIEKLDLGLQADVIQAMLDKTDPAALTFVVEEDHLVSMVPGWRQVCSHAEIAQSSYNLLRDVYDNIDIKYSRQRAGLMETRFLLPTEQPITKTVGDVLRMGIDVRHKYGTDISAQLFIERLICLNGATTAEYAFAWTQRTLGDAKHQLTWLRSGIQGALSAYDNFVERARLMAQTEVTGDLTDQLIRRARAMRIPRQYERQLIDAFNQESGNTEWHMLNALTRFASHNEGLDNSMRNRIQRAAGDWTREYDIVTARLPRPIANSVGAEIIYGEDDE